MSFDVTSDTIYYSIDGVDAATGVIQLAYAINLPIDIEIISSGDLSTRGEAITEYRFSVTAILTTWATVVTGQADENGNFPFSHAQFDLGAFEKYFRVLTVRVVPLIKLDDSEARKIAAPSNSFISPIAPSGFFENHRLSTEKQSSQIDIEHPLSLTQQQLSRWQPTFTPALVIQNVNTLHLGNHPLHEILDLGQLRGIRLSAKSPAPMFGNDLNRRRLSFL
ncbi:MAG: hypothetical protein M2R45_04022 [Verrucomicrobia subdivision 3 bacterium]|nr:hypothetical protein [Limisphaerales bacterium]MCS1416227.1 hypothetical protein [Limisphaerales bacterium]